MEDSILDLIEESTAFPNDELEEAERRKRKDRERRRLGEYLSESIEADNNIDYLEEKSHGKLKYDFRLGFDYDTGHSIKIIYSLDDIKVDMAGGAYKKDEYGNKKDPKNIEYRSSKDVTDQVEKTISKKGDLDHASHGQKVLAIVDRKTGKRLQSARVIGLYNDNVKSSFDKLELTPTSKRNLRYTSEYDFPLVEVGEIDHESTFKSTKLFKSKRYTDYEGETHDSATNKLQAAYNLKYGRGAKMDDVAPERFGSKGLTYEHPSKKDINRNPDRYHRESIEDDSLELLTEASYKHSTTLDQIEKDFKNLIDYTMQFYNNMKKRKLDPSNPNDIYQYYFTNLPEKDQFRYSQYNEYLKNIEDKIKKMFKFRSVNIGFQLLNIYGPHTRIDHKQIMSVPVLHKSGYYSIEDFPDLGVITWNGNKVKYQIGYKTTLKASDTGIVDTNDAITLDVNLMMYENMEPKHYVAILLHEIGHNLDIERINADVKNDSKMISVVSYAVKKSKLDQLPGTVSIFFRLLGEKIKSNKSYQEILGDELEKVGKAIGHGTGDDKHSELFADALPNAYGYGPALIDALQKFGGDFGDIKFKETKGLFSAYSNYKTAISLASRLQRREDDVHGTNMLRLRQLIASMEADLKICKDSKIKQRLKSNIKELKALADDIVNNADVPEEVHKMLAAWADVDNFKAKEKSQSKSKPDTKAAVKKESISYNDLFESSDVEDDDSIFAMLRFSYVY